MLSISKDALHIHIGLGIYVAAMLLFRRGPGSIVPWLVVLAFELTNELLDGLHHFSLDTNMTEALRDIGNTMLWPTIVFLVARQLRKRSSVATEKTVHAVSSSQRVQT